MGKRESRKDNRRGNHESPHRSGDFAFFAECDMVRGLGGEVKKHDLTFF